MRENGYQVIARRWRPKQFDELVGQDHIVRTLSNAIESQRIAHAYLFVGPRGTGKTSTARLFAKALNAEGGPTIHPDNDSDVSQAIMNGSCMDVIEIDGASNNSVDQVRDLREDCQYAPTQCRYKIYIIDEVHMLSTAAFNALLKTLEEPPEHVKFFFATTEAHKVLQTIVSRCQRFEFRPIPNQVIAEKLSMIAAAEGIQADLSALQSIASLANGGMRDAQSILDQMISFCGQNISESDVLDVYGLVSADRIEALAQAMVAMKYAEIISAVDAFAAEGRDLFRVLVDLQACVRQGLMDAIQQGGHSSRFGQSISTESLMRMLDALQSAELNVQQGLSEKANFEVALLKAAEEARSRAIDSLIQQIAKVGDLQPEKKELKLPRAEASHSASIHQQRQLQEKVPAADRVAESSEEAVEGALYAAFESELVSADACEAMDVHPAEMMELEVTAKVEADLMGVDEALEKVNAESLRALSKYFNGELTTVRSVDQQDCLF